MFTQADLLIVNHGHTYIDFDCAMCQFFYRVRCCHLGVCDFGLIECPKYEEYRKSLFESASELSIHFNDLSNYNKFIWIMSNENVTLIKELGIFLTIASEKQALSYQ